MLTVWTCLTLIASRALIAWQAPGDAANLPAQAIRPNDLITVAIYGSPELSRSIRVGSDGSIRLPMLKDRIAAEGSLPADLENRVAQALADAEVLVDPVVTITIADYAARPISVVGAVRHPLTFDAKGRIALLDALARAEGLTAEAGSEILITRANTLVKRVSAKELHLGTNPEANPLLEGGEEVRVPEAGRVFVVGNVKHPGAYRLDDEMTVLKALALAEGLAPFAAKDAYIYRRDGQREIPVTLRQILDRKAADVGLSANDILYIPDNRRSRATASAIERALTFAAGTASGALILGVNR